MSGWNQQFAKLSLCENSAVGSNPTLTAKFLTNRVLLWPINYINVQFVNINTTKKSTARGKPYQSTGTVQSVVVLKKSILRWLLTELNFLKIFDDDNESYLIWDFDSHGFVVVLEV